MTDLAAPPLGAGRPRSVAAVVDALAYGERRDSPRPRVTTGFDVLDAALDGLRAGELVVVGGVPGVGKTVATLQWARHMAATGHTVVYACYEHDEADLLGRLLAAELGEVATAHDIVRVEALRTRVRSALTGGEDLVALAGAEPLLHAAIGRLDAYADNLHLVRASGAHTDVGALADIVAETGADALFVDYLQKVPVSPTPADESERVTVVAGALKELALSHGIAVVAVAAATRRGLEAARLRLHHLRGSSALAYEADAIVLLNPKATAVSKAHRAYDPVRAETFKQWAVFTIEKNRSGPNLVDVEFRTDFAHFRFDPRGGYVAERLVDERVHEE